MTRTRSVLRRRARSTAITTTTIGETNMTLPDSGRPHRVRLERYTREEAFVLVEASDDAQAKERALELVRKIHWTFVATGVTATLAPFEGGSDV
jgi:hypothetical protein